MLKDMQTILLIKTEIKPHKLYEKVNKETKK